jgi:excisionase family DNA binding protein
VSTGPLLPKVDAYRLKPSDVAQRLRISEDLVYRLIDRGELEAALIGRILRISETGLTAYLERAKVRSRNRKKRRQ